MATPGRLARRLLRGPLCLGQKSARAAGYHQAIQFKDKAAARRLILTARELWKKDLVPGNDFDASTISRIRSNSVRRVAQLCQQPFVTEWTELHDEFTLLGCGNWLEARFLLERNRIVDAQQFLDKAIEYAPNSVEVLAYLAIPGLPYPPSY